MMTHAESKAPSDIPKRHYAAVAVDRALDMDLTYDIPPELLPVLQIGARVRVPLGRGNKPVDGTILDITDQAFQEPYF